MGLLCAARGAFRGSQASGDVGLSLCRYQVVGAASKAKADKTAVTAAAKRLEGLAVTGTATAAPHGALTCEI